MEAVWSRYDKETFFSVGAAKESVTRGSLAFHILRYECFKGKSKQIIICNHYWAIRVL